MTKDQLLQIAKAGLPDRTKQFIDFSKCKMHHRASTYDLIDENVEFYGRVPMKYYIKIFMPENGFVQITPGYNQFNHYAAIKKMEELQLI